MADRPQKNYIKLLVTIVMYCIVEISHWVMHGSLNDRVIFTVTKINFITKNKDSSGMDSWNGLMILLGRPIVLSWWHGGMNVWQRKLKTTNIYTFYLYNLFYKL